MKHIIGITETNHVFDIYQILRCKDEALQQEADKLYYTIVSEGFDKNLIKRLEDILDKIIPLSDEEFKRNIVTYNKYMVLYSSYDKYKNEFYTCMYLIVDETTLIEVVNNIAADNKEVRERFEDMQAGDEIDRMKSENGLFGV